jgi:type II secretory pathway component PulM
MEALRNWFASLAPREQRAVLAGACVAALVLLLAALLPLERAVSRQRQQVAQAEDDVQWLRGVAPQLAPLVRGAGAGTHEPLVVLVDRVAREAGMARSVSSQPGEGGSLNVRLDQVSFDALVRWMGSLAMNYHVRILSANIDVAGPGLVSASLALAGG